MKINELSDNMKFSGIYLCKDKYIRKTKTNKDYITFRLWDVTGYIDAKIWDITDKIQSFKTNDFIEVEGNITTYNGNLQAIIYAISPTSDVNINEFIPLSNFDVDSKFNEVLGLINTINNTYLKELLNKFFTNDKLVNVFKKHTAAKQIHHAFVGGLLLHSLNVAKLCDNLSNQYKEIDRDLLITSALLHDIGKIKELSPMPINDYTDSGQLLGHIVLGAMWINEEISTIPNFPKDLKQKLIHCILTHHGELEYGSPKKPAILEALVLSMADNMDAKIETFTELISEHQNEEWTGYNRLFDTNIKVH